MTKADQRDKIVEDMNYCKINIVIQFPSITAFDKFFRNDWLDLFPLIKKPVKTKSYNFGMDVVIEKNKA